VGVPVSGDNYIHINPLLSRLVRIQMFLPGILQKLLKRKRQIRKQRIEVHPQHPVWIADIQSPIDKGDFAPYANDVVVREWLEVRVECVSTINNPPLKNHSSAIQTYVCVWAAQLDGAYGDSPVSLGVHVLIPQTLFPITHIPRLKRDNRELLLLRPDHAPLAASHRVNLSLQHLYLS